MVNAIAHIHIEATWLTKERFVLRTPAPVAMAGGVVLGISLGFHHHAPQQLATLLAFHQPAANQVGGNQLGRAAEERERQSGEIVGDGLGGYGSGFRI